MQIDHERISRDARATWDADAALRAEFGIFERYAAYREATALGVVRVAHHAVGADGEIRHRGAR